MIGRVLVILLALFAGSLVVSGQDGESTKLLREIEQLTERLRRKADATHARSRKGTPVLRIYDVSDLVGTVGDAVAQFPDLPPSKYMPPESPEPDEPVADIEIDELAGLIRQGIEPESWDAVERASIQPVWPRLFIRNLPRVHQKVERLLAWKRSTVRRISVEVAAVAVSDSMRARVDAVQRDLPPTLARELLSGDVLGRFAAVGRSTQQFAGKNGRNVRYLHDYDVEIAEGAATGDPYTHDLFLGLAAQIRACIDETSNGALVYARLSLTSANEDFAVRQTEHGPLELPHMKLTRSVSTFWVPLGRTVIAGGGNLDGRSVVFLVTVRLLPRVR